jgi:hypothetical protein
VEKEAVSWGPNSVFSSEYTVVDRSDEALFSATGGVMYTNQDWHLTAVAQYLYNGSGYGTVNLGDLLQTLKDRAMGTSQPEGEPTLSFAGLLSSLGSLGKLGRHYGALYLGWSSIFDSDFGLSALALANFSDGSGYVKPTLSFSGLDHVTLSTSATFTWGGDGTEYADAAGLLGALAKQDFAYVTKPTMTLALDVSIATTSF